MGIWKRKDILQEMHEQTFRGMKGNAGPGNGVGLE